MNGWRGTWARAQITGVVFSSLVWIVVAGLSTSALAVILAVGIVAVAGRNTRAMLWWRYGASPANDFQRTEVLTAIVPVTSLRGRNQPAIWIGCQLGSGLAAMPSRSDLIVSPEFVGDVIRGQLTDRQASAVISQALGHRQVHASTWVNAVEVYCVPWRFVQILTGAASQIASRGPMLGFSWKIRWIVFGVAMVDNYLNARWAALIGVGVIAVLSWSTGYFQKRWSRRLEDLGDQRAIAEGLGPDLAELIQSGDRSLATGERANRLRRDPPSRTDSAGRVPEGALRTAPDGGRLGSRACAGRTQR